jgi:N-acetylglutamate synthase-like GNAT family acetyltransferase
MACRSTTSGKPLDSKNVESDGLQSESKQMTDNFLLRAASESDFPAIKALIHEVGINPTGLDWHRFIVAETLDGQFVGCGQLKPHSDGTLEMASIAVKSAWREKGVARIIIQKLMAAAPRPLYLTCRAQMGPFYERFGFRAVSGAELPRYFRRLSQVAGLIGKLHLVNDTMLVMVKTE